MEDRCEQFTIRYNLVIEKEIGFLVGMVAEDIETFGAAMSSVTFRHVNHLCNNSAQSFARRA